MPGPARTAALSIPGRADAMDHPTVDVHAHFFPRISRGQGAMLGSDGPWLRDDGDGTGQLMAGNAEFRPVEATLWDPDVRVARMDEHGVDVQVV